MSYLFFKDINREEFDEFGQEDKEIAIAGILSIQYGNTCEMLYAGMDERFKKFGLTSNLVTLL